MSSLSRPEVVILLRWTALFVPGWLIQQLLRAQHPRWRVILWRGLLCACVAVPLMQFIAAPVLRIPILRAPGVVQESPELRSLRGSAASSTAQASTPVPQMQSVQPFTKAVPRQISAAQAFSFRSGLLIIWSLGAAFAALRLLRLQVQLWGLKRHSRLADEFFVKQANEIQKRLGVRRKIAVRVSDRVSSSFLTGLWRPTIILPATLVRDLSSDEISALLAHEIAHVKRHDLFWCIGWQWARALLWFHPFVWKIPAAHNLACEQEADRMACGQAESSGFYRQLLARLTLRILDLPPVESQLALNANSQIAKRLNHLERGRAGEWDWKRSVIGCALVFAFALVVTRGEFSRAAEATNATASANFQFKETQVIVQDEHGKPIAGARIVVTGFRVKGRHSPDAYGWRKDFGPAPVVVTDAKGKAFVKYPVMSIPEEKEYTGALIFHVEHTEFSMADVQEFYINGSSNPVRMTHGASIEMSGFFGPDHQPVPIVPNLSGFYLPRTNSASAISWTFNQLARGGHLIQLMGRLPSGEIGYSDTEAFSAESGQHIKMDLEIKPGIRLEGKLDDQVPRPIKNGRVMVSVRPKEFPAGPVIEDFYSLREVTNYNNVYFWQSYRPIAEDGTFVLESVPPGEADVVVLGDGFVSKSIGKLQNRVNGQLIPGPPMGIPQVFALSAPVTQITVATEPTVTLKFTTKTQTGEPLEGVSVGMHPDAFRMRGIFGWTPDYSERPFHVMRELERPIFWGKTDKGGNIVLTNIPAEIYGFSAESDTYQLPLQGGMQVRFVHTKYSPGETIVTNLVMLPRGTEFMGSAK